MKGGFGAAVDDTTCGGSGGLCGSADEFQKVSYKCKNTSNRSKNNGSGHKIKGQLAEQVLLFGQVCVKT